MARLAMDTRGVSRKLGASNDTSTHQNEATHLAEADASIKKMKAVKAHAKTLRKACEDNFEYCTPTLKQVWAPGRIGRAGLTLNLSRINKAPLYANALFGICAEVQLVSVTLCSSDPSTQMGAGVRSSPQTATIPPWYSGGASHTKD